MARSRVMTRLTRDQRLSPAAVVVLRYLRSVGVEVTVRTCIDGAGLDAPTGYAALGMLEQRGIVTLRSRPGAGETVAVRRR